MNSVDDTIARLTARLAEETAIVDRIWDIYGRPTYAQLAGRSIYDLISADKARLAEFDGFPNLTAMREAMVGAADECRELKAWRYEAEQLLRLCVDSVHRDGRPHLLTMIQAALGDTEAADESADDPSRCPECGLGPSFDGMWHLVNCSKNGYPYG